LSLLRGFLQLSFFAPLGLRLHIAIAAVFSLASKQPSLAMMATDLAGVAALHPLNAVVTFALGVWTDCRLHRLVAKVRPRAG